jgi:hypothetical protein
MQPKSKNLFYYCLSKRDAPDDYGKTVMQAITESTPAMYNQQKIPRFNIAVLGLIMAILLGIFIVWEAFSSPNSCTLYYNRSNENLPIFIIGTVAYVYVHPSIDEQCIVRRVPSRC